MSKIILNIQVTWQCIFEDELPIQLKDISFYQVGTLGFPLAVVDDDAGEVGVTSLK